MIPAITLPSVLCAASPITTAVTAPPRAIARGSRSTIRSATTTITSSVRSCSRKLTVDAVPGSKRRIRRGPIARPMSRANRHPIAASSTAAIIRTGTSLPNRSSRHFQSATTASPEHEHQQRLAPSLSRAARGLGGHQPRERRLLVEADVALPRGVVGPAALFGSLVRKCPVVVVRHGRNRSGPAVRVRAGLRSPRSGTRRRARRICRPAPRHGIPTPLAPATSPIPRPLD